MGKQFGPWIFAIASNVLRTSWKRTKQDQNRVIQFFYPDDPEQNNPETEALQTEANTELERTLRRLPHDLYEVLYLYYYEGLPVAEIANTLSIGEENVKSRLFRGRKKIRSLLQPDQHQRGTI